MEALLLEVFLERYLFFAAQQGVLPNKANSQIFEVYEKTPFTGLYICKMFSSNCLAEKSPWTHHMA
jgi:hypothetical protein